MRKIREQGGTSCKLLWTDWRGKRKERRVSRMKDEGGMVKGDDKGLEVMPKH